MEICCVNLKGTVRALVMYKSIASPNIWAKRPVQGIP